MRAIRSNQRQPSENYSAGCALDRENESNPEQPKATLTKANAGVACFGEEWQLLQMGAEYSGPDLATLYRDGTMRVTTEKSRRRSERPGSWPWWR